MYRRFSAALVIASGLTITLPALGQQPAIFSAKDIFHPVFSRNGMVASQEARATRIGVRILRRGGNAVDAAVAVGFALAVTLPRAGNIGGGGFMLVHQAKSGETQAIDYREMAPKAAHKDMFLKADGNVDKKRSRYDPLAVGVPGTVAGFALAHKRYGKLPWVELLLPAIRLASDGIKVTPDLARSLRRAEKRLGKNPAAKAIFYKANGDLYRVGARLRQPDLAASLIAIAANGAKAFYEGEIANKIARDMANLGGLITWEDLKSYRAVLRSPVKGTYRGHEIASMPPPSSGGVHLIQLLNILEGFPLSDWGHNSAKTIHVMAEAMKQAYADRAQHLGDPDFWAVPIKGLTAKKYADLQRAKISLAKVLAAKDIRAGNPVPFESNETTHFSIMDKEGNVVSNTYTLNFSFGAGIVAADTGILLNNEMDDFSAKIGVPNAYGLIGGKANSVAAGKRPLSSMTPTIVFKDGKALLATGSPGGSRIITTVLQIILNIIDHKMNIAAATAAPRIHHQWLPDEIRVEAGLNPDTAAILSELGHKLKRKWVMGSVQSVMRMERGLLGASDPRRRGALTSGH